MIRQLKLIRGPLSASRSTPWRFPLLRLYFSLARAGVRADMSLHEIHAERLSAFSRYHRHFRNDRSLTFAKKFYGYYKDAEVTAFSGRIGDAVGLMAAHKEGFCWFAHFEDLGVGSKTHVRKRPDYIVIDPFTRRARLLECKGSLGQAGPATLEGRLDKALQEQIEPWIGLQVQYSPTTGFVSVDEGMAVGTLIKQRVNSVRLKVVRPSPNPVAAGLRPVIDPVAVHYGRYLQLLDLPRFARALRQPGAQARQNLELDFRDVVLLRTFVSGNALVFPVRRADLDAFLRALDRAAPPAARARALHAALYPERHYPFLDGPSGPLPVLFGLQERVFDVLRELAGSRPGGRIDRLLPLLFELTVPEQLEEVEQTLTPAPQGEPAAVLSRDGAGALVFTPDSALEWGIIDNR